MSEETRTPEEWFAMYMLLIEGRRDSQTGPYWNHLDSEHAKFLDKIWAYLLYDKCDEETLRWVQQSNSRGLRNDSGHTKKSRRWMELWRGSE